MLLASLLLGVLTKFPAPIETYKGSATAHVRQGGEDVEVTSEVSFQIVNGPDEKSPRISAQFYCDFQCAGKLHPTHAECDKSCDVTCPYEHKVDVPTEAMLEPLNIRNAMTKAEVDAIGGSYFDISYPPTVTAVERALDEKIHEYRAGKVSLESTHFADSCSASMKVYPTKIIPLLASISVKTTIKKGSNTSVVEKETQVRVGHLETLDRAGAYETDRVTLCRCQNLMPPKYYNLTGIRQVSGPPVDPATIRFVGGLDGVKMHLTMPVGAPCKFMIGAGVNLISDDRLDQLLAILWGEEYEYDDWDSYASVDPPLGPPKDLQVACLEMNKQMPSKSTFRVVPSTDPILRELASMGKDALIRGLDDQPRLWIYTDKASIDDINKHLMPRVSVSTYLKALHQCYLGKGLNLELAEYRRCVEPKLLRGLLAPPAAKAWLVRTLVQLDSKGLGEFLSKEGASFPELLKGPAEEKGMGELLDAFAGAGAGELARPLSEFCAAAIPAEKLANILKQSKHYQAMVKAMAAK